MLVYDRKKETKNEKSRDFNLTLTKYKWEMRDISSKVARKIKLSIIASEPEFDKKKYIVRYLRIYMQINVVKPHSQIWLAAWKNSTDHERKESNIWTWIYQHDVIYRFCTSIDLTFLFYENNNNLSWKLHINIYLR